MILDITQEQTSVEIGAQGIAEIVQNVRTILATIKGTVPLDREFGIDPTFLDSSLPSSRALYAAEVVQAINANEPRVDVEKVLWAENQTDLMDGKQVPTIRIKIKEGVEI